MAWLDVEAISSKSLFSFSLGLTLIIKRQMLSSIRYFQSAFVPGSMFKKRTVQKPIIPTEIKIYKMTEIEVLTQQIESAYK